VLALSLPVRRKSLEDDAVRICTLTGLGTAAGPDESERSHIGSVHPDADARLNHTRLDDAGMASLAGMRSLAKLYARDTLITDAGLKHLAELRDLTELDLYGTRITDAGISHLKELRKLVKLNLLGASLTDAGFEHLAGLRSCRS
jgi:hypothetical protein